MSPSWFTPAFKARTGLAVHSYVHERRLHRALGLLQRSGLTIAVIARCTGFADHAHLTRSVRRRHGTTPTEMRER